MRITTAVLSVPLMALCACTATPPAGEKPAPPQSRIESDSSFSGFFDLRWDANEGRIYVAIDEFDRQFLYQSALARGLGSNDIGLDRGQLGATRVVSFVRSGPKVLLVADNLTYRAASANRFEQKAIDESFARSVLYGFKVAQERAGVVWVDATDFFLRDAHGLAARLEAQEHGVFTVDPERSSIFLPRTRAFVDNTEVEAIVTFVGTASGEILPTVVPDPNAITVHLHHSFVRLPEPGYEPLAYEPRAGFIDTDFFGGFYDYAAPIDQPMAKSFARRHRLHKKNPGAAMSEAREPIVYYVDRGAPEPVRSALIEGARWWNQAFEAAGFRDAFQVRLLPEDADPMDVRFNVIQWVHRSTRGWSYGSTVTDPRTGEIIKGHVTLGSLRVRQDFLLAEGLLSPYAGDENTAPMLEMALARIRQLSAHEVGHTIGLEHNFAGSANDRSSVMDYPFPLIAVDDGGRIDLSAAYARGIGSWDARAIAWGYTDLSHTDDAAAQRRAILAKTYADGHLFVADRHARAVGTMHPDGSLWDNGADPVAELAKLRRVRRIALNGMSEATIRRGRPLATIEEALVPMYLLHRYQIQAVGKLIGGARFHYAVRGDGRTPIEPVPDARQRAALDALLQTMTPSELALPAALLDVLPTRPPGFGPTRELFARHTGDAFDVYAPARAYTGLCLQVLLDPARAERLLQAHGQAASRLGFRDVLDALMQHTWYAPRTASASGAYQRVMNELVVERLLALARATSASAQVRATAWGVLRELHERMNAGALAAPAPAWSDHDRFARAQIESLLDEPAALPPALAPPAPPGSPIGGRPRPRPL